jgi:[FeFe] hydrogenase (group B1/B3)
MLELNNQYTLMKRRLQTEVLKQFFAGTLEKDADKIPFIVIPKDRIPNRCCIYKERAMVRYRIMAFLGIDIERFDDEMKPLTEYVKEVMETDQPPAPSLTTISTACSACPPNQYRVSDSCRGCFARPCIANCPRDAINFINGRAHIQEERCVKCGKCMEVCPFHAVIHIPVPCEDACPVGAVKKNEAGYVEIDHKKCISCGRCAMSCPFGAIVERSGIFPVLKMLASGKPVTAMIAPAIEGQFPGTLSQIKEALLNVGFAKVVEVSRGAEVTAQREAKELKKRKEEGRGWMTTSCCPAYLEIGNKLLPYLKEKRSDAKTPMGYTAEICKSEDPGSFTVFVGPCLAKKIEAARDPNVDGVITFSELACIFMAKGLDVREMKKADLGDTSSFEDCRGFAITHGVADSVMRRYDGPAPKVLPVNGVDKKAYTLMKVWEKHAPDADIVEVMCCEGGCIAGPGTVVKPAVAMKLRGGEKAATPVKSMSK